MKAQFLLLSLALLISLAACGGKTPLAADLKVVDQREVRIEGADLLSLSPDGRWLLAGKGSALCFYQTASLAEQSCAEGDAVAVADLPHIAWSPAGSGSAQVAFTENMPRYLRESDLWLLQAETGELTNLTPDGLDGPVSFDQGSQALDITPAWSPDGKTLLFSRSAMGDGSVTALYRIPAAGGSPTRLLDVSDVPGALWYSLLWPARAQAIFYTVTLSRTDDPANGVWMADPDGQNPQRLIGADQRLGPPVVMDVSATGSRALIWYILVTPPDNSWYLFDVAARTARPLLDESTAGAAWVSNALFSPDGTKLLYTVQGDAGCQMFVRDVDTAAGSAANLLLSLDGPCGATRDYGVGLDWAAGNTVFVAVERGARGLLLELGPK